MVLIEEQVRILGEQLPDLVRLALLEEFWDTLCYQCALFIDLLDAARALAFLRLAVWAAHPGRLLEWDVQLGQRGPALQGGLLRVAVFLGNLESVDFFLHLGFSANLAPVLRDFLLVELAQAPFVVAVCHIVWREWACFHVCFFVLGIMCYCWARMVLLLSTNAVLARDLQDGVENAVLFLELQILSLLISISCILLY